MAIKEFFRLHYLAVILALGIGVISVAPQVFVLWDQQYRGVQMFGTDAEYFYVGEINRARYEDYSRGIFPPDPGKDFYLAPKLGQRIMAISAEVFNAGSAAVNVFFKFLCPAILFLILYFWLLEMSVGQIIALVAPLFVILGTNLLRPGDILRLGLFQAGVYDFLPYTRPISPQLSSIMLFIGLWLIYRLVYKNIYPVRDREGSQRVPVSCGINFQNASILGILSGISLYLYIYTWTFLSAVIGLYLIYFLIRWNREKIKYLFLVLAVNGVVALPFFLNLLKARLDPDYLYSTKRIGLLYSHMPIMGLWVIAGLLALAFLWPNAHKNVRNFFLFNFAALVLVLNQQIITGFQLQPGHFHWFYTKPLIAIVIIFLAVYWLEKIVSKKLIITAGIILGSLFFLNGSLIQAHSYTANYPTFLANQRYAPVLDFLNKEYSDEKNIWAHIDLSSLIVAYTRHQAYLQDEYSYSYDYVRDNLFLEYRLGGIHGKNIMSTMIRDRGTILNRLFGIYYRDLSGLDQRTDADLAMDAADYEKFYAIPLDQILRKLNINLIITDADDDTAGLDKLKFLSKVYTAGELSVYQFTAK